MKEQLISFETANLANSKDIKNLMKDGKLCTQSLLQKYLREEFDIHIIIASSNIKGYNYGVTKEKGFLGISTKEFPYNTYEEALEAGLQEGLKLI